MKISPTPKDPQEAIHLSKSEFFEVYECLHTLILEELLFEHDYMEGSHLIKKSLELLHLETDEKKKYDFIKGFIPLYKRMHDTLKKQSREDELYRVAFS
jgi:hypothetical protein